MRRLRYTSMLFDLFHTLVEPDDHRAGPGGKEYRAGLMLGTDPSRFAAFWRQSERQRLTDGRCRVADALAQYVESTGEPIPDNVLREVEQEWGRSEDEAMRSPDPDAGPCLVALAARGVSLGLLSNADERTARAWVGSPLHSHFRAVAFSYEIGAAKPDRLAYRRALELLGADPQDAVFVGDGGAGELRGARMAGFGLVVFMRGHLLRTGRCGVARLAERAAEADLVLDRLSDLPDQLSMVLTK